MSSPCAKRPSIDNYVATADPVVIRLPSTTSRYLLQVREAVDATIAVQPANRELWTLRAGSTLSEERLALDAELVLEVSTTAGSTVEVWSWGE